jgi:hypothetical protein
MPFVNCPRCGLSIRLRAAYLAPERCPRCLVRRSEDVAMYVSDEPGGPPAGGEPGQQPAGDETN